LRALSSDCSDHAPLILRTDVVPWARKRFRFESFWTKLPGFLDVVASAWGPSLIHADAFRCLDYKLRNTARALKSWSAKHVGSVRLQLAVAREVILRLDAAMEQRALTLEEQALRKELKCKCLGLASLARTIATQRSRMLFLAEGDANTRFFPPTGVPPQSSESHCLPQGRRGFDSLVALTCWSLWKERNARTFRGEASSAADLVTGISQEAKLWVWSGFACLSFLLVMM
jgi:hypothetical protein